MKTIKQAYHIASSLEEVWKALTDPKSIEAWGGGPAKMKASEGYKFSLWGGSIWGKNLEVSDQKKLVQEWWSSDEPKWTQPSKVTFNLSFKGEKVTIDLLHEKVPDANAKDIAEGWKEYYLGPLKESLESK